MDPERWTVRRGGVRLDRCVANALGCGRRAARALLQDGLVRVDGRLVPASERPAEGSIIEVERPPSAMRSSSADSVELCELPHVLYRDEGCLVIDKPAGMHTLRGRGAVSAEEAIERMEPGLAAVREATGDSCFVHRLDCETSGVLVAAMNAEVWGGLREAFRARNVEKYYYAIVSGVVDAPFTTATPLARRNSHVTAARRSDRALAARTDVRPLECGQDWSLVECAMRTGVTHQIRAHLALSGHPIIGDDKYGGRVAPQPSRAAQLLHACRVVVAGRLDVSSDPPDDFVRVLEKLRLDRSSES